MAPSVWMLAPMAQRQLRAWTLRLESLKEIRQQEENCLGALRVSGMDDVAATAARVLGQKGFAIQDGI